MTILVKHFNLKSVIKKSYHGGLKYHMTLNAVFSVVMGL